MAMLRNFGALLLSTLMRVLTNMVLFVIMARLWGAESFGQFMYMISVATLLTLLCEFGFTQQILKEAGTCHEATDELAARLINGKFWLTLLTWAAATVYLLVGGLPPNLILPFVLLLASSTVLSFADFFSTFLKAKFFYKEDVKISLWANVVLFGVAMLAVYFWPEQFLPVSIVFFLARCIHLGLAVRQYRQSISTSMQVSIHFGRAVAVIRQNVAYGLDVAVGTAFANVDGLLVTHFLGYAANGIYQGAARFYQGASLLPPLFASLFLPRLARAIDQDKPDMVSRLTVMMYTSMLALGFLILIFFWFSGSLLHFIYNDSQLNEAATLMPVFGVLVLVRFLAASQGITVTVLSGQKIRGMLFLGSLLLLIILGAWLLPVYGVAGIVIAASLSYLSLSFSFWFWIQKQGHSHTALMLAGHTLAFAALAYCFLDRVS